MAVDRYRLTRGALSRYRFGTETATLMSGAPQLRWTPVPIAFDRAGRSPPRRPCAAAPEFRAFNLRTTLPQRTTQYPHGHRFRPLVVEPVPGRAPQLFVVPPPIFGRGGTLFGASEVVGATRTLRKEPGTEQPAFAVGARTEGSTLYYMGLDGSCAPHTALRCAIIRVRRTFRVWQSDWVLERTELETDDRARKPYAGAVST